MILPLITVIRKNQQVLLIIVSVLVIIAFVWLYDRTEFDKLGADRVARIYDTTVTLVDVDRGQRLFSLAQELGLMDLLITLADSQDPEANPVEEFIWNRYVLQHEAGRLGLNPTSDQIDRLVRQLPAFQVEGRFDPQLFGIFLQEGLAPRGFTERALEELVADQLRLQSLRELVESTVPVPRSEVASIYEQMNTEVRLALVEINIDRLDAEPEISEEEVKLYYETNREQLNTEEERTVQYVVFALDDAARELEGRERVAALQEVANQANAFTMAMVEEDADFAAEAANFEVEVHEVGPVARGEVPSELRRIRGATEAIFAMTEADPNSEPLRDNDSFAIFHLTEVIEPRPLELEEARDRIVARLRDERLRELAAEEAAATRLAILERLAEGDSLREVVAERGFRLIEPAPFTMARPDMEIPHLERIYERIMELPTGGISPFIPTREGGLLVYVRSRQEPDDLFLDQELEIFTDQYAQGKARAVFQEWLAEQRVRARLTPL